MANKKKWHQHRTAMHLALHSNNNKYNIISIVPFCMRCSNASTIFFIKLHQVHDKQCITVQPLRDSRVHPGHLMNANSAEWSLRFWTKAISMVRPLVHLSRQLMSTFTTCHLLLFIREADIHFTIP